MKITEPDLIVATRLLLEKAGFRAKKKLGQHFLTDMIALQKIVAAADLADNETVIEIGPGLGFLTEELAAKAGKVIAVELDGRLIQILKANLSKFRNITFVQGDILKFSPTELLALVTAKMKRYKVVANLPYYITTPILRHFLEAKLPPALMVLMLQKEVGEDILAKGGRTSFLSLSIQFHAIPSLITVVPALNFYPPPKVDSVVVRLDLLQEPVVKVNDVPRFFEFIRAGFASPRKQLGNSFAKGLGIAKVEATELLNMADIEATRRAESVVLEEWAKLWEIWSSKRKDSPC